MMRMILYMKIIFAGFLWNVTCQQVFQEVRVIIFSELCFHEVAFIPLNETQ